MTTRHPLRDFYPPLNNPAVLAIARGMLLPFLLRWWDKIVGVEIDPDSRERLLSLRGQRVALCPNHPSRTDGDVMLHLSGVLGGDWNYLSGREVFAVPWQARLQQWLGCYSIIRDAIDRESFRITRQILSDGARWLVLFPEGEACGQNDTLAPFHQGIVQFGFWALDDLAAKHPGEPLPPVYLAPLAIRYLYTRDMRREIDRALTRLEEALHLPGAPELDRYARLRRVGEAVLSGVEREYGIAVDGLPFGERIQRAREAILARAAAELGVTFKPGQPQLERMRLLFNAYDRAVQDATPEDARRLPALYQELWRVARFAATYDGYVRESMTAERYLEIITRLEWEVFRKVRWHGPRNVLIQAAAPLNLADHYADYRQDKRATLAHVTLRLEEEIRVMLHAQQGRMTPV